MSRSLTSQFLANIAGAHVTVFPLVDLNFASGLLQVCGAPFDVTWSGNTYLATGGLGSIEPIVETDADVRGLAMVLSGVNSAMISQALSENLANRLCTVRIATVDSSGNLAVDSNAWQGYMDQFSVSDDGKTVSLKLTAENRMASWRQPPAVTFSKESHQTRHPTDQFFNWITDVAAKPIVWPNVEFFKR